MATPLTLRVADERAWVTPMPHITLRAADVLKAFGIWPGRGAHDDPSDAPPPAHALPVGLLPEQAVLAVELGVAEPATADEQCALQAWREDQGVAARVLVLRECWQRRWFVADGFKFGGHFLLYHGSPHEHHAWAVALVAMPDESLSLQAIAASAKVANHAKKQLVIAMPELAAARVQFVVLSWARLRRRYYDAAPATAAD